MDPSEDQRAVLERGRNCPPNHISRQQRPFVPLLLHTPSQVPIVPEPPPISGLRGLDFLFEIAYHWPYTFKIPDLQGGPWSR